jgi:hypothetical protein
MTLNEYSETNVAVSAQVTGATDDTTKNAVHDVFEEQEATVNFLSCGSSPTSFSLHTFVSHYMKQCLEDHKQRADDNTTTTLQEDIIMDATVMFVQRYFPKFNTLPDANTKKVLTSIMHAAMTVAPSLADADNNYENAVATVCNSIKQIFPQRAMFN